MSKRGPSHIMVGVLAGALLAPIGASTAAAQAPLADAPSPHLRKHSEGPVQWLPWESASFKKAEEEKKLLFASIGYNACHWCRLMDDESYRDPKLAAMLNRSFVCVKVDRLLRPDIDLAIRTYAQATGNASGWPINVWMTPAGQPVSVGSYFPPRTPGNGTPGLEKVIEHIQKQWSQHPKYVHEQSVRDMEKIRKRIDRKPLAEVEAADPARFKDEFYSRLAAAFDPISGGFDTGIKFPRAEVLEALTTYATLEKPDSFRRKQIVKMLSRTLDGMLAGGVIDPLDGGLFRYANDPAWRVPQFEKMLIDQARFANAALAIYQLTGDKNYAETARGVLAFAGASLHDPAGGYHASLAADSGPEANQLGAYYIWRAAELTALLDPEEAAAFNAAFGIRIGGNVPPAAKISAIDHKANILQGAKAGARAPEPGSPLASALAKVRAARAALLPPLNDSILAGENGLMISALARAGKVLEDPALTAAANATARAIVTKMFDATTKTLARAHIGGRNIGDAFADDYIFLARGLIDLHRTTGDPTALKMAATLQAIADERFFDTEIGLYHLSPIAAKDALPTRLWPVQDSDQPSANGVGALNLIDLAQLQGSPVSGRAASVLHAMAPNIQANPIGCPSALLATLRLPAGAAKE